MYAYSWVRIIFPSPSDRRNLFFFLVNKGCVSVVHGNKRFLTALLSINDPWFTWIIMTIINQLISLKVVHVVSPLRTHLLKIILDYLWKFYLLAVQNLQVVISLNLARGVKVLFRLNLIIISFLVHCGASSLGSRMRLFMSWIASWRDIYCWRQLVFDCEVILGRTYSWAGVNWGKHVIRLYTHCGNPSCSLEISVVLLT